MLDVQIRQLIRNDMERVCEIERACFEHWWTKEMLLEQLGKRNSIGMVAECRDYGIVGFMVYELEKHSVDLVDFAVDPKAMRRGVGTQMMRRMVGKLKQHRRTDIDAMVHENNLAAQLFFKSQEFYVVHIHRDYYEQDGGDAYEFNFHDLEKCVTWTESDILEQPE